MEWVLEHTVHKGATLGDEVFFTDSDFADDVSLLAEMLDVLLLALDISNQEAQHFGLKMKIDWNKTYIQTFQTIQYLAPSKRQATQSRLLINLPISAVRLTALTASETA